MISTTRATHGYRYCGVSATLGGRGFSPTCFIPWIRAILMVRDVRGLEWSFIRCQKLRLSGEICHVRRRERLDWDSLPALSDIGVSKSYNCINISYTKIQNNTTTIVVFIVSYTYSPESRLHIQKLYIYIYRSERRTYSDEPLRGCWPSRMRKITVSFFCTYTD